ncbi:hypothetical protein [Paenibacillus solani]|uniref:ArsR family transcriptional regulator n=1 Tax=Paenibacillus solani TaxID=1705565 RepID=A0A0M1P3P7_9BACL|nr:hypothetical protein [Paenibacillus solani]KOR89017.1 ArsR family transcriptional regulator [Paenibacillus solani]
MKKTLAGWALALLTAGILAWTHAQNHSEPSIAKAAHSQGLIKNVPVPWSATKNTIRLNTSDPVDAAVLTSKTLWQSTSDHSRPQSVILVDPADWSIAAVSTKLTQLSEGPLLFVNHDRIPKETLEELRRLKPRGVENNKGIEIITVGPISEKVLQELDELNYKVEHIAVKEAAKAAAVIDQYAAKVTGKLSEAVIVGTMEHPDYTLPAVSWIVHQPETLLYVSEKDVPEETIQALEKRQGDAHIYVIGPYKAVSRSVEQKLQKYGKVTRISGSNPVENAIHFAKFKDAGTGFGWGIQRAGYSFSITTSESPVLSIAAASLSHMGRHAPLLYTERNGVSHPVVKYIESIQQPSTEPTMETLNNHAWIIGDEHNLTTKLQSELDEILDTKAGHGQYER